MELEYLIKFAQVHETFRRAEIEALAIVENISLTVVDYNNEVGSNRLLPFVRFH